MKQRPLRLVVAGFFFTTLLASEASRIPGQSTLYDFPLTFEENRGQVDDRFDYVARGPGYGLYLSGGELLLGLRHGSGPEAPAEILRMRLEGGLAAPSVRPLEPVATKSHYYRGNDPSQWVTNVPHYKRVRYSEVYPGVDLVLYGTPGDLEYDFIVSPNASWQQIRLQFEGVDDLSIGPGGQLVLKLKQGEIVQPPPTIYQESHDGQRLPIRGSYILAGSREVAFHVESYDHTSPLVIDPEVLYLGYLGGTSFTDNPHDIATDSTGAAYVTGQTFSSDFPASIGSLSGGSDAYVAKINAQGTAIEWAAFFGGTSDDWGNSIAVDATQQVYFCGATESSDLATANPYQSSLEGSEDAFVAMLSSTGASLLYSSYLGGATEPGFSFATDACNGIDVDSSLIYAGGVTNTSDFDTTLGAFDTTGPTGFSKSGFSDDSEAFISVFNPSLSGAATLVYSTYLGSERGEDIIYDLAVIAAGEVAVTGRTTVVAPAQPGSLAPAGTATPFPTTIDAFQLSFQGGFADAFVTRLDTTALAAAALVYSTFFGSTISFDEARSIDVLADDAFIVGTTSASGSAFPTTVGAYQTSNSGSGELFIARFDTSGSGGAVPSLAPQGPPSTLTYSTLYGGSDYEEGGGIAVNSSGEAYILADTTSSDLPLANAFQSTFLGDVESPQLVVASFNSTGTTLDLASYLGGGEDFASGGVVLAPNGDMLIAATSSSSGLATSGSFDETLATGGKAPNPAGGPSGFFGQDGIVARIGEPADLDLTVTDSPDPVNAGANITYGITIENLGTAAATNTTLTVSIFQSTFVSSTGTCAENSGVVTCDVGTIPPPPPPGPAPAGASSLSFDLVIQVDPFFDGSSVDHTFDVAADQFDLDLSNNSVTVDTDVEFEADLEVTKTDSADPVSEDDTFDYTVTVTNNGPSGAEGVSLLDTIPPELTFVSSDPDDLDEICFFEDPDLDCFFGDLDPGASEIVTITVMAGPGPATAINTATVSSFTTDSTGGNDSVGEDTTILGGPDLTVGVTDVPDPVTAGTNLTYNVTVMNPGTAAATGTVLDVTLDSGLSFVSSSQPPPLAISVQGTVVCTPSGSSVSCDLGTIAAQGSVPVSIVTSVNPGQTAALASLFDVSTIDTESDLLNNSETELTTVTTSADLSVSKTDSVDPVGTEHLLTYTITATNQGPSNATGVVIQDTLPGGVTLSSNSPSCSLDGSLFCDLGNLMVGQSKQVTVVVTVEAPPGTTLTNTASVSGAQTDPNGSNDSIPELTAVELHADLTVELLPPLEVPFFGLPMNIQATFRNLGPESAINGNVNILFPGVFTVDSVSSDFSCNPVGNQVLCDFGVFPYRQTASASITATPSQGGDFTISASINSLSTDPVPGNDTDEIMFNIPDDLDLAIVKTPRFDIAAVGRPFWYEIEIENLGNGPFADIQIVDELTDGLQVNGVTTEDPIDCTEAPTFISCVIAALNPGQTVAFVLEVQVGEELLGPFLNTVEAIAEGDQEPENDSSTGPAVEAAPGDANADGAFDAADIVWLVLEINDGDGDEVSEADGGTFKGNPTMDVDGDGLITLADYDALLALIFP